jgi:hypothetical protein
MLDSTWSPSDFTVGLDPLRRLQYDAAASSGEGRTQLSSGQRGRVACPMCDGATTSTAGAEARWSPVQRRGSTAAEDNPQPALTTGVPVALRKRGLPINSRISPAISGPRVSRAKWLASSRCSSASGRSRV